MIDDPTIVPGDESVPPPYESRLAALEARVQALEARVGQSPPAAAAEPPLSADSPDLWLAEVAARAKAGDRSGAIALYQQNMASDLQEATSFVDDLTGQPPGGQ